MLYDIRPVLKIKSQSMPVAQEPLNTYSSSVFNLFAPLFIIVLNINFVYYIHPNLLFTERYHCFRANEYVLLSITCQHG